MGGYDYNEHISRVTCLACLGLEPDIEIDFTFRTDNGAPHPSWVNKALREKVVLIDYTQEKGTGCPGCDKMHPIMSELADDYQDLVDFIVVYMNKEGERQDSYGIYHDDPRKPVPTIIIITLNEDADGRVKPYHTKIVGGSISKSELVELLDDALALHLNYRFQYSG